MTGRAGALMLAVAVDLVAGELPPGGHPVVWVGWALRWAERRVPGRSVTDGAVAVGAVVAATAAAAALVGLAARRLGWARLPIEALALKPAFSIRRLATAAGAVEAALRAGHLARARTRVGRDLVSRPTGALDASEVTSAAVESVAENLVDSVAAPLLAYAAGGLPAAWAYRAVNTADAMWGYRDACYERFGKVAARLDDVANLVPARLGAACLTAGAALSGEDAAGAARVAWRQHGRTASPNAGWPMAAMAGALGVGLAKRGSYRLGEGPLPETPDAIRRACRVYAWGTALAVAVAVGVALCRERRS